MINYALRILGPVLCGKASIVEIDYEAEKKHVYHMQAELKKRVWSTGCKSVRYFFFWGAGGKTSDIPSVVHQRERMEFDVIPVESSPLLVP